MSKFRKTNASVLRKRESGLKDGQTLFYGTLPATVGDPIKVNKNVVLPKMLTQNYDLNY